MADKTVYTVESTRSTTYLDKAQRVVNGYEIMVFYPEFDEIHSFEVPDLKAATVDAAAMEFYNQRKALP